MNISSIIDKVKYKDHQAFRELVEMFSGRLMVIAKMMTKNIQDAEDVLQESFISVFQNIDQFHSTTDDAFYAWSKKIVLNKGIAMYRRKYYSHESDEINPNHQIFQIPDVFRKLNNEEFMNYVYQLPLQYRQALCLYALEGYSHDEIADRLKIKASTSRSLYTRAKKKLHAIIPDHFYFTKNLL